MPEMRDIHLLKSMPFFQLAQTENLCSPTLSGHDWARLLWEDMIVGIRCQRCGREPLDIMQQWRTGDADVH